MEIFPAGSVSISASAPRTNSPSTVGPLAVVTPEALKVRLAGVRSDASGKTVGVRRISLPSTVATHFETTGSIVTPIEMETAGRKSREFD